VVERSRVSIGIIKKKKGGAKGKLNKGDFKKRSAYGGAEG
jgi:hypothetical protein